jgi:hypothetical protein
MKIRPVGAELFHAGGRTDGQTDVTKLTVAFRNFANAPKNDLGSVDVDWEIFVIKNCLPKLRYGVWTEMKRVQLTDSEGS